MSCNLAGVPGLSIKTYREHSSAALQCSDLRVEVFNEKGNRRRPDLNCDEMKVPGDSILKS